MRMRNLSSHARLAALCLGLLPTSTLLANVISIEPSLTQITQGNVFSVDIRASGLDTAPLTPIGAYDLTLGFDQYALSVVDVAFSDGLGMQPFDVLTEQSQDSGTLHLAAVSLLEPDALQALQGDSFSLATLTFMATGAGSTALNWLSVNLFDVDGLPFPAQSLDANIEVIAAANPVPLPGALVLFLSGLLTFLLPTRGTPRS